MGTYIIRDVFNLLRERWRKGLGMERYTEDALMSDMILCLRELDSHVQPNTCRVLAKLATDYTKQLADAQATVEALQARVKELEQWVSDQSNANLQTMRHLDDMQTRAMEAEAQLAALQRELESANALIYKKNCAIGKAETTIEALQREGEQHG